MNGRIVSLTDFTTFMRMEGQLRSSVDRYNEARRNIVVAHGIWQGKHPFKEPESGIWRGILRRSCIATSDGGSITGIFQRNLSLILQVSLFPQSVCLLSVDDRQLIQQGSAPAFGMNPLGLTLCKLPLGDL